MTLFAFLALLAGSCIAIQAAMNARLGVLLNGSWIATGYAFLTSFLFVTLILLLVNAKQTTHSLGNIEVATIPWYLWLSGVLSVIGVGSMYWLIPKMGVGSLMSFVLTGQIVVAMLISHLGLFASPQKMITAPKLLGTLLLIAAIILINKE